MIASGELRAGDRLAESTLSAQLGVSRSPVREALRELEHQGLVVSYPSRGAFVVTLDDADVEEIRVCRAWFEGLAARLAADRMARRDFAVIEAIVADMENAARADPPSMRGVLDADERFHAAVVGFSGNRRLQQAWHAHDPMVWLLKLRAADSMRSRVLSLPDLHRRLLTALRSSPDEAEAEARRHVLDDHDLTPGLTEPADPSKLSAAAGP